MDRVRDTPEGAQTKQRHSKPRQKIPLGKCHTLVASQYWRTRMTRFLNCQKYLRATLLKINHHQKSKQTEKNFKTYTRKFLNQFKS